MRVFAMALVPVALIAADAAPRPVASAQAGASGLAPSDVFRLRTLGAVAIRPDGRIAAYVVREPDIMTDGMRQSIHVVDVESGAEQWVVADADQPTWSEDGTRLAWVSSGADGSTLFVAGPDGNDARAVGRPDGEYSSIAWSPSGREIAFTRFVPHSEPTFRYPVAKPQGAIWARAPVVRTDLEIQRDGEAVFRPGHSQLFTVSLAGASVRRLTTGDVDVSNPAWAHDGRGIFFFTQEGGELERSYKTSRLRRVALSTGSVATIDTPGLAPRAVAVSPDGHHLAFVASARTTRDYEPSGLYLMENSGRGLRRLDAGLDREIGEPRFSADGRSVFDAYADDGAMRLARFAITGAHTILLDRLDGAYAVSRGGSVVFAAPSAAAPADVAVREADGRTRTLTYLNEALLSGRTMASKRVLEVRSSLDGLRVGTWLTMPPGWRPGDRPPLVLAIHGGPYGADGPWWNTQDQLLASAGYAVLHANYRGSISYGFAFADRIARDYPGPSYADLISAVDAAVAQGFADKSRLFVTGGSAGGMLTAWIVGSTDRFRAAVAEKPIINPLSEALTTDQATAERDAYGAYPWENPSAYTARSPLALVGRVHTPTMLVVGDLDMRTRPTEAQQFYVALKLRGVPTVFAVMPGAGHDSLEGSPSRLIAVTQLMLDWFGAHGGTPLAR